jgi:sugar lactone lactonase YvrE
VAVLAITAGAQTVPSIVVSSATTISVSGLSSVGKVVQDTCGNLYELEASGELEEVPANGGAVANLVNYGSKWSGDGLLGGVAIDKNNNLYVDNKWNGAVIMIPSSNCVPNTAAASSVLNGFGWYDPGDIATDALGDLFVVVLYGSGEIEEQTAAGKSVSVLAGGTAEPTSIAVDSSGDVFFTVSGSGTVYEVPSGSYGTSSPTAVITSGLTTALGVSFDTVGNLYIGDSGTGSIYEVPFATAGTSTTPTLQFGSMYLVASGLPLGNPLTVSADGKSILYSNSSASIYDQVPGSANFGGVAVGAKEASTINVAFNAAVTPASLAFSANAAFASTGGSCAAGTSYTAGNACTITAQFNPAAPGNAVGGVTLTGSNGAALATVYLKGTGLAAGLTVDAGTASSVGGGFTSPASVALDGAGNSYFADAGANAVLEFTPGSTKAISIGSSLSKPLGVAVDGAGDVMIADTGNNQVVEVPVVNGALSNSAQTAIISSKTSIAGSTLSGPAGVTVDGQGNLYIADTGNNRIVYVPYNGIWEVSQASVLGTNLTSPLATAIDSSGTLYVADSGSGQIYKFPQPFSSGIQQLVAVGYSNPSALATDASGSLFVVNQGGGSIVRIPNISGSLNPNEAIQAGLGNANPYGLAVDQSGNLYVADSTAAAAYLISRTSTTQAFGDWAVGSPSGPSTVQVENEGNQALTFASPFYTGSGNTGDFTLSSPSNACANSETVAVGASCELDATFLPTISGTRTETLVLSSNAQNAASSQVVLTGSGTSAVSTTTALAITSPASGKPFFGEPITLTATVHSASGTPAGSAQLLVDGVITGESALNGSGGATFNLTTGLTGGSHSLQAAYLGSSAFDGSTSLIMGLSVSTAPTNSTLAITAPYTNPYSADSGASVTFTVTVNSTGVGIPTGTVSFVTGSTALGTVALLPASGGSFQASLTTTSLPVGTDLVTATYTGDANYVGSSTSGTVIVVSGATVVISASGTTLTSSTSSTSSITFTHVSEGGWAGVVGYSCLASSLPANARCVFSPGQAEVFPSTSSATTQIPTTTLTVTIDNPPQTPTASKLIWWIGGLTGLFLFWTRRRMMRSAWGTITMLIGAALLAVSASGLMACSNGIQYATPAGTSTVTVYASADPYATGSTTETQACVNPTTNVTGPTQGPCTQQSFQASLTVQ